MGLAYEYIIYMSFSVEYTLSFSYLNFSCFWCFYCSQVIICCVFLPLNHHFFSWNLLCRLRDPTASASQILGLKACSTSTQLNHHFLKHFICAYVCSMYVYVCVVHKFTKRYAHTYILTWMPKTRCLPLSPSTSIFNYTFIYCVCKKASVHVCTCGYVCTHDTVWVDQRTPCRSNSLLLPCGPWRRNSDHQPYMLSHLSLASTLPSQKGSISLSLSLLPATDLWTLVLTPLLAWQASKLYWCATPSLLLNAGATDSWFHMVLDEGNQPFMLAL